ncbi:MAG TPA: aldo/keto reductase [bacterium]|nr:aldo/keto reductase [bacterium]
MKRREFFKTAALGTLAAGTTGCSSMLRKQVEIKPKIHDFSNEFLEVTKPKPKGTMEMREVGKTGIKVSYFTFGSHTPRELMAFPDYRKNMLLEAYDLGVNTFDVYPPQYETTGEYLRPLKQKVVISMYGGRTEGRSATEEHERVLRIFKRDYIDMVRVHAHTHDAEKWPDWEELFRLREKGYIRAVGVPIHYPEEMDVILAEDIPIDFVILPYNFYHNILYTGKYPDDFDPLAVTLRKKGIGVITMKPFASEWYVAHLMEVAKDFIKNGELSLGQAMLRYILNSGLEPDTVMGGMWCMNDVNDNIAAFFDPKISSDEEKLLDNVRNYTKLIEEAALPPHYRFLKKWAPEMNGNSDVRMA